MANIIENEIHIKLKKSPEDVVGRIKYKAGCEGLSKVLTKLEEEKKFNDLVLGDPQVSYEESEKKYIITFHSKTTEQKELTDKIYGGYGRVISTVVYTFLDIDGQDYGGRYYYLANETTEFDFDTDYFEDHNDFLEDGLKEPDIEDYFYLEGVKYISTIEITLKDDPDKLISYLNHLENECKWQETLLYDFNYVYDEEAGTIQIEFNSYSTDSQNLSHKLFMYSQDSIDVLTHIFYALFEFGGKMVFKDTSVKIFQLNAEYFDDLEVYNDELRLADTAEAIDSLKKPDISNYFIEQKEVSLVEE